MRTNFIALVGTIVTFCFAASPAGAVRQSRDNVEELGGSGPRIAVTELRISEAEVGLPIPLSPSIFEPPTVEICHHPELGFVLPIGRCSRDSSEAHAAPESLL